MEAIRVGVIGCGKIAESVHIPSYIENPKSCLVAVCDTDKDRLSRVADRHKVPNRFSDYKELLESNLVDAVSVCTPTATHAKVSIDASNQGIHVLCEKPLASSLEEGRSISDAVHKSNIKFMVGFNCRFIPNHTLTKRFVDQGRIGKPVFVRGHVITPGPFGSEADETKRSHEVGERLGVFFDLGSHLVDLFVWLVGQPEEVYAAFSSSKRQTSIDDSASALIKFRSGVLGSLSVAWLDLPDYQATAGSRIVEIVGTEGKIASDFFGPSMWFYSSKSITSKIRGMTRITPGKINPKIPDEGLRWSYKKEIDLFLESIIQNKEPPVSLDHAITVLRLLVAGRQSASEKSAIAIE